MRVMTFPLSVGFLVAVVFCGCTSRDQPIAEPGTTAALLPEPMRMVLASADSLTLGGFDWDFTQAPDWATVGDRWRTEWFSEVFPDSRTDRRPLTFKSDTSLAEEAYVLSVEAVGVTIAAGDKAGAVHGLVSLRQMLPIACETGTCESVKLPLVRISDSPSYPHRGLLLDACRHFQPIDRVKHLIDQLALHKMNVLHWHLTEDQGWRIEIAAYPRLTEVGAWRTEKDSSQHGGFYTKAEIREVVDYAAVRGVEIIPEIELPGHSRAAIAAYPWLSCTGEALPVPNDWGVFKDIYCAGNDSTLAFLKTVLDEVVELFPSRYVHIGGDEAPKVRWSACEKCQTRIAANHLHAEHDLQSWFINEIGAHLATHGKTLIGWDEILEGGIPEGATVQSWRGVDGGIQALRAGHDAILSPTSHCYFDYPLQATDLAEVYTFGTVLDAIPRDAPGRLLGGECNMWTEHAPAHLVDAKIFPRLVAMSEVLWGTADTARYDAFLARLDRHYDRLDAQGVDFGLETVPVTATSHIEDGQLSVLIEPAMRGVTGNAGFVPTITGIPEQVTALPATFTIDGLGEVRAEITHRHRILDLPERFPVAGHLGLAASHVDMRHTPSPYYPGGGPEGLADGWRGSTDFRDGHWQASQGEDMGVQLAWPQTVQVDSVTVQFYLYQDAWIFLPDKIQLAYSTSDDEVDILAFMPAELGWPPVQEPDDRQTIVSLTLPLDVRTDAVWFQAFNSGPCPDWHDAATEPTWLFMDEFVVHGAAN